MALAGASLLVVAGCARQSVNFTQVTELPPQVAKWPQANPKTPSAHVLEIDNDLYVMVTNGEECSPQNNSMKVEQVALEGRGKIWVKTRYVAETNDETGVPRAYLHIPTPGLRAEIKLQVGDAPPIALRRQSPTDGEQLYLAEGIYKCGK
jgi:hypothetical protein